MMRQKSLADGGYPPWKVAACAAMFAAAVIPVLITPVLPTIDFYDHVARYFVLVARRCKPFLGAELREELVAAAQYRHGRDRGLGDAPAAAAGGRPRADAGSMLVQFSGVLALNCELTGWLSLVTALLLLPLMYSYIFVGLRQFPAGVGAGVLGGRVVALVATAPGRGLACRLPAGCGDLPVPRPGLCPLRRARGGTRRASSCASDGSGPRCATSRPCWRRRWRRC